MLSEGEKYSVEALIAPNGSVPLLDFIAEAMKKNSEDLAVIIANLKKASNPALHGEPLTKPLRGNLKGVFEIRFRISTGAARILYVYKPGKLMIIMNGVVKKGNNFLRTQEKAILKLKHIAESEGALHEKIDFTIFDS